MSFTAALKRSSRVSLGTVWAPLGRRTLVTSCKELDHTQLSVTKADKLKELLPNDKLKFGATFTDHMLVCDWTESKGWHAPAIVPYGPLAIDPAASVLHYSLQCFEGMKAYRSDNDDILLFRPDMNMKRLNRSMRRLYLPEFSGEEMVKCIGELLKVDKRWIPHGEGYSLYIRPTGISTHPFLGVGPAKAARVFTILSPVGPYYPEGFAPVRLYADRKYVRAWPGGTGDAKVGGNYGATILPQMEAAQKGYTQVLWLFGEDNELTEVGTMNFFAFIKNKDGERELVTPPLDGTILPGVTRQSILDLARSWGEFRVSERKFKMKELQECVAEDRVIEMFGAGTAAVVSPIKTIHFAGTDYDIPLGEERNADAGPLTKRMWDTITGIQYGRIPSEWSVKVE